MFFLGPLRGREGFVQDSRERVEIRRHVVGERIVAGERGHRRPGHIEKHLPRRFGIGGEHQADGPRLKRKGVEVKIVRFAHHAGLGVDARAFDHFSRDTFAGVGGGEKCLGDQRLPRGFIVDFAGFDETQKRVGGKLGAGAVRQIDDGIERRGELQIGRMRGKRQQQAGGEPARGSWLTIDDGGES